MYGYQGGCAGKFDWHRRAFKTKHERDASYHCTDTVSKIIVMPAIYHQITVFTIGNAKIYAAKTAFESSSVNARILKGLPTGLQQQSLLWIHGARFYRENVEKPGIELIQIVNETAYAIYRFLRSFIAQGTGPRPGVPSSIGNRIFFCLQLMPESGQI